MTLTPKPRGKAAQQYAAWNAELEADLALLKQKVVITDALLADAVSELERQATKIRGLLTERKV